MKTTTNHGLKKPDGTDTVNIEDLNYNADKLDALLVPATTTANGLMSKDDKTKLNGIAAGANNYTHPATHPASMISGLQKVATSGSYNDLLNKPSTFPPSNHTHDDRYYTESEIDNKLKGVTEKINDCFKPKGDLTGSANTFVENGVGRDIGSMTELPSAFGNIITFNSGTGGGCYLTQLYANNNYLGYRFGADNNLNDSNWKEIATTSSTVANANTVGGISASDLMRMSQGQTITGTKEFISQSVGADFSNAAIQVRETQSVGGNNRTVEYAPSIGFHWSNTGAGSIAMHSDGSFHFRAQGYTSSNNVYRNVVANDYLLADGTSLKSIASQSPIKSIQRGVHGGGTGNVTISISAVNASKSIVILNNSVTDANDQYNYVPVLVSLSSTNFVVSKSAYASSATQFSWQVIEFN